MATETATTKMYGGHNRTFTHPSSACACDMKFTVFVPPTASESSKVPVIYYLSGLTCDDSNVIIKSNVQRVAAELGVAIVCPDTSPRPTEEIEGMKDSYDFGIGAGFYLNATVDKWKNWRMYEYVTAELPAVLGAMPMLDLSKQSIMGHSMGGHGALTIALKNPTKYKSVSAFSPIVNPTAVPWGEKAFSGYLGEDKSTWDEYDACQLLKNYDGPRLPVLVDQGTADNFLESQLKTENLQEAAKAANYPMTIRMQEGYDHSYFFIATFMEDHVRFHAEALKA